MASRAIAHVFLWRGAGWVSARSTAISSVPWGEPGVGARGQGLPEAGEPRTSSRGPGRMKGRRPAQGSAGAASHRCVARALLSDGQ